MANGKFLQIKTESGENMVVFSHSTSAVKDSKGNTVVFPTGGLAIIKGTVVKELE